MASIAGLGVQRGAEELRVQFPGQFLPQIPGCLRAEKGAVAYWPPTLQTQPMLPLGEWHPEGWKVIFQTEGLYSATLVIAAGIIWFCAALPANCKTAKLATFALCRCPSQPLGSEQSVPEGCSH